MKKINITKREIFFFFMGVITVIIIGVITNWEETKRDFLDGLNGTRTEVSE